MGVGEGSFLLAVTHLVFSSHPPPRQPQWLAGSTGWAGEVERTEPQGEGDKNNDDG